MGALFNFRLDYDDENIIKAKANKIKDIKKIIKQLEVKFK